MSFDTSLDKWSLSTYVFIIQINVSKWLLIQPQYKSQKWMFNGVDGIEFFQAELEKS